MDSLRQMLKENKKRFKMLLYLLIAIATIITIFLRIDLSIYLLIVVPLAIFVMLLNSNESSPPKTLSSAKTVTGKVLDKKCMVLAEDYVARWGTDSRNARYNLLIIEDENGEILNILTSQMADFVSPFKALENDDSRFEKGETVELRIEKYDDFLFYIEGLFIKKTL